MQQVVAAHYSRPAHSAQALTIPLARDYRIARQALAELEDAELALAEGLQRVHDEWVAVGEPEEEGGDRPC